MNVSLWVVQGLLALVFAGSGAVKAVASKEWLVASGQTGVSHYSLGFIRFVAVAELLGAIGLIAPCLLGIAYVLTPLAALCLGALMVGAARAHTRLAGENRENAARRRKEITNVSANTLLLILCAIVLAGRGIQSVGWHG